MNKTSSSNTGVNSVLMIAVREATAKYVVQLIEAGADVNIVDHLKFICSSTSYKVW